MDPSHSYSLTYLTHSPLILPFLQTLLVSDIVKLDSQDTPPPLHFSPAVSDRERSSTAETTPIGTPRGFGAPLPRKTDKEKENWLAWHHKHSGLGGTAYVDSTLLDSDFEDTTFPLFNDPPPVLNMASRTTPIDIATSSSRAASPRGNQTSNLTSALQSTSANEARPTTAMDTSGTPGKSFAAFGGFGGATPGSQHSEAQPISMNASNREKPRRESLAGSMVTGMSWGGNSVGSWIRDEYVSTVSSPSARSFADHLQYHYARDTPVRLPISLISLLVLPSQVGGQLHARLLVLRYEPSFAPRIITAL